MSDKSEIDKKKKYNKKYYDLHKDKWSSPITCQECGNTYTLNGKYSHFRSKKHKMGIIIKQKEKEINDLKSELENKNSVSS